MFPFSRFLRITTTSSVKSCRLYSSVARNNTRFNFRIVNRSHTITTNSWAADKLEAAGEKLEKGPELPLIEYTEDLVRTPPEHIKQLCHQILCLNVVETHQLMNLIQKRLGLSDADMAAQRGGGGGGEVASEAPAQAAAPVVAAKAKEAFDIKLTVVDAKAKIKIIKEVRAMTGLGLKEAKELVEKAPVVIKEGVKKEEADNLLKLLVDAGAQAELLGDSAELLSFRWPSTCFSSSNEITELKISEC
eukprot:gene1131-2193_t